MRTPYPPLWRYVTVTGPKGRTASGIPFVVIDTKTGDDGIRVLLA